MSLIEELSCGGIAPTGPCSAWPQERHNALLAANTKIVSAPQPEHVTHVSAGVGKMAGGLLKVAGQAITHGKVSREIREERYDTCKACPFFVEDSKRCSECGCFMEAKTWVGGDPDNLCPQKKWSR